MSDCEEQRPPALKRRILSDTLTPAVKAGASTPEIDRAFQDGGEGRAFLSATPPFKLRRLVQECLASSPSAPCTGARRGCGAVRGALG